MLSIYCTDFSFDTFSSILLDSPCFNAHYIGGRKNLWPSESKYAKFESISTSWQNLTTLSGKYYHQIHLQMNFLVEGKSWFKTKMYLFFFNEHSCLLFFMLPKWMLQRSHWCMSSFLYICFGVWQYLFIVFYVYHLWKSETWKVL